jgi:hypothetical protein
MLNVLEVETTASIIHNCHHTKYMKYVNHNYDYINKKLHL